MEKIRILNSKEVKNIKKTIKEQWDAQVDLDYAFLANKKGKIFIVNREIGGLDFSKLRMNSLGLYFGELRFTEFRLSIEGSQIIGPNAKKNIIDIDDNNLELWMKGETIEVKDSNLKDFIIIKNKKDFLGCGKYKEGKILNYVPKERWAYLF